MIFAMPFNSLLLSKDSETVQILGRVLKDLEIRVEHCTEPFNAAKLIMDQHFDAIIVDCDDAQGAAWVLQGARTAAANKTALTIAIVQDHPGGHPVSKLGENFALHKPIVASQAESTLKAARNLMKSGAPSAPPAPTPNSTAAFASSAPPTSSPSPVRSASPFASGTNAVPSPLHTSNSGAAAAFAPAREPDAKAVLPSIMAEGITTSEEIFRRFPVTSPVKPSQQTEAARRPAGLKSHVTDSNPPSALLDHHAPVSAFRSRMPVAASEPKSSLRLLIVVVCVALALAAAGLGWRNLHSAVQQDAQPLQLRAVPLTENSSTGSASSDQIAAPSVNPPQQTLVQPKSDKQPDADQPAEQSEAVETAPKKEAANENVVQPAAHAHHPSAHPEQSATVDTDEPEATPPSLGAVSAASSPSGIAGVVSGVPVSLPTVAPPTRISISQGISQGMLIHQVHPVYPLMAKQARIQGDVLVRAFINKQGGVDDVTLVSGPSLLVRAALTAVKQWRYRPYLLNGQAVEVETLITIKFTL